MSGPAVKYRGEVTVRGQVTDFQDLIDPQTWHTNYPFIWLASYLIDGPLPQDRDQVPAALPRQQNPSGQLFERVLFGGVIYNNVIDIHSTTTAGASPRLDLAYAQVDCRSTTVIGDLLPPRDGGIDIDTGIAACVPDRAGFVKLTVTKDVRFTEPDELFPEFNLLWESVINLTMDALLQSVLFVGA